jgi:hypothetical protein
MDLVERELKQAANIVLNRYLVETQRSENFDALAALPLFLSLRAAIRAKVTAARVSVAPAAERFELASTARNYFSFACAFIRPAEPTLVAVGGLSGTGKSVLARALAPEIPPSPGAIVLRSDSERKSQFGVAETERLGHEAYRTEVNMSIYAVLAEKAHRILAAGHSAIIDAVFARPEERRMIEDAAVGRSFRGLFLEADLPTRLSRVNHRTGDVSDANADVVRQQETYDVGLMDWTTLDASASPAEILAAARISLRR